MACYFRRSLQKTKKNREFVSKRPLKEKVTRKFAATGVNLGDLFEFVNDELQQRSTVSSCDAESTLSA